MIVVIPTMYLNHLDNFFENYESIDLTHVEKIILFNNSDKNYEVKFKKFHILNLGENIGVNAVWNHGLKIAEVNNSDLMLLNDDVLFKPSFFSKTFQALEENRHFAVVCPFTMRTKEDFNLGFNPDIEPRYSMMRKRNGWCFTINKSFIPKIKLIPKEMEIFFGDDWIWHFTRQLWVRDNRNIIYHQVGKTMAKNKELRAKYHNDKTHYKAVLEKIKSENT